MKKLLSMVLSVAILVSIASIPVFAEETTDNVAISATKETYIELENYAASIGVKSKNWDGTHGGAYAFNGGSGEADQTMVVPITVEKTGVYKLEYVGSSANWLSDGTIYVDDVASIRLNQTANSSVEPAEGTYFDPYSETTNNFPAYKYTIPVELNAGEHTISVKHFMRSASGVAFAADYIMLEPVVSNDIISGTNETYLEMEKFHANIPRGASKSDDRAHGGFYLNADLYINEPATSLVIPFHAEKTGYYDIEVRMNKMGNTYVSENTVSLDGYTLFSNNAKYNYGVDVSQGNTFFDANWPMHSYFTRVYLAEGEHSMFFHIKKATSQNLLSIKGDYIKFTPAASYVLSTEVPTTIEAEAFIDQCDVPFKAKLVEDEPNASGNAYIYTLGAGTRDSRYHIPFTVEKAGIYQFETVQAFANYMSNVEFYLDGSDTPIIGNVTKSKLQDQPFNVDKNINTIAHLYQFNMELSAGEHGLTVVYKTRPAHQDTVAYASDYYRFTLMPEKAIADTNTKTISVSASYLDPVAGTILIVAYSGKEMVGIKSVDQIDENPVTDTVSYIGDKVPDTVKVFVWDTLDNVIPLQSVKVIAVN